MKYIHEFKNGILKVKCSFHDFVQESIRLSIRNLPSHDRHNPQFHGDASTFDVMVKRCYDGYNARKVGEKRQEINSMLQHERSTPDMRHEGDELDVPTYLSGDMRCFWAEPDDVRAAKRFHLVYQPFSHHLTPPESFLNHGGAMAAIADAMNESGALVKMSVIMATREVFNNGDNLLEVITTKEYAENIDTARIGAVTHPSFLRRIALGFRERVSVDVGRNSSVDLSYGYPMADGARRSIISDDDLISWLGVSSDEVLIELPSPMLSVFKDTVSTARWVEAAIQKINTSTDENRVEIFQ